MKKILILAVALAMGFSVYASEPVNYMGFGYRIPTSSTVKSKNHDKCPDIKFKMQTGLSIDYIFAEENGFTMRGILGANYSGSDFKPGSGKDEMNGFNFLALVGVGYAPIRTEKMFLGLYCVLGADTTMLYYEETLTSPYGKEKYTVDLKHISTVAGANATFVYTPAKRFSIFASVCANIMLPTKFEVEATAEENGVKENFDDKFNCMAAFKFVPSLGVCWKF